MTNKKQNPVVTFQDQLLWRESQKRIGRTILSIKKKLKVYNTLLSNDIRYYEDIHNIIKEADKKYLLALKDKIYTFLPKIGFEGVEEIDIPTLDDQNIVTGDLKALLDKSISLTKGHNIEKAENQQISMLTEYIVEEINEGEAYYSAVRHYEIYSAKLKQELAIGVLIGYPQVDWEMFKYIKYYQYTLGQINIKNWNQGLVENRKQSLLEESIPKYHRCIIDCNFSINMEEIKLNAISDALHRSTQKEVY